MEEEGTYTLPDLLASGPEKGQLDGLEGPRAARTELSPSPCHRTHRLTPSYPALVAPWSPAPTSHVCGVVGSDAQADLTRPVSGVAEPREAAVRQPLPLPLPLQSF